MVASTLTTNEKRKLSVDLFMSGMVLTLAVCLLAFMVFKTKLVAAFARPYGEQWIKEAVIRVNLAHGG